MDGYHFWADLLDTFQSAPNWIKALWVALCLLIPPGFVLALIALVLRYRIASKRAKIAIEGELIYSVLRSADGELRIVRHAPQVEEKPALILLNAANPEPQTDQDDASQRVE